MFTGIVQAKGIIGSLDAVADALRMKILVPDSPGFFAPAFPGASVANNGVCLTVEESGTESGVESNIDFAVFTLVRQTISCTHFADARVGDTVNLEYPCRADSWMGGHFVMGHVDAVGRVAQVVPQGTGVEVSVELPESLMRYVISKGSIALNGISLTVAEKLTQGSLRGVRVAIVPETLEKTNLSLWKEGTPINVEVDMMAKYVENFTNLMKT
jgi:riboflavin synthase